MSKVCRQRGMSSILAIFLVTVLAVMATVGVQMLRGARNDATLDMQLQRARNAARAGLQVGFFNARSGLCTNASINNLPQTLSTFTVTITCTLVPYSDGGVANVQLIRLQAVACNRPVATGSCPNNPASATDLYVEAIESGECIADAGGTRCRYR